MEDKKELDPFLVYKPQFNSDSFSLGKSYRITTKNKSGLPYSCDVIVTALEPLKVEICYFGNSSSSRSTEDKEMLTRWITVEEVFSGDIKFEEVMTLQGAKRHLDSNRDLLG